MSLGARRLGLVFLMTVAFACSDDAAINPPGTNDTGADAARDAHTTTDLVDDVGEKIDTGVADAFDADTISDTDTAGGNTRYTLCLLGSDPPTSPNCVGGDQLDFGWIPINSRAERRFRFENTGESRIWMLSVTIPSDESSDAEFETSIYKLEVDPNNPNRRIRVPESLPSRLNAGETLFVDVAVIAGLETGALPADSALVEVDINRAEFVTLTVALTGEIGECESGRGSCDGSAATGCETDTGANTANCGGCGLICSLANVDSHCVEGGCQINGQCVPGFANCDKKISSGCEANVLSDDANCGGCGRSCARENAETGCNGSGTCNFACHTGFGDCNSDLPQDSSDGCEVDIHNSPTHCGSCSFVCNLPNANEGCAQGACTVESCVGDHFDCDTLAANGCEVDLANDVNNCNACANKCSFPNAGARCAARTCEIDFCFTDYADCTAAPGCETNTTTNVNHCGGCGQACELANATPRCSGSGCLIDSCNTGFANCDNTAATGCEADVRDDDHNCGGCGRSCARENADSGCNGSGSCNFACHTGFADCNNDLPLATSDGCEIDTRSAIAHCGACNAACNLPNAVPGCTSSGCTIEACNGDFANCDTSTTNGCETNLANDVNNCNACNNKCSFPNAAAKCEQRGCAIDFCFTDYANCTDAPGCETNTTNNANHCGGCGQVCELANATARCSASGCLIDSCNPGFANCDGNHTNGCETNLLADDDNCGGCGRSCERDNAGSACNGAGTCDFACHTGFADCNNDLPLTPSNGCEINIHTSPANCGACNAACNLPNAVPGCTLGDCTIEACNGDFANCDTSTTNGCETNLANDVNNCNACSNKCSFPNAGAKCTTRTCEIDFCFTDYADCTTAPGCETNTTNDVNHCGGCNLACNLPNATARCSASGCLIDSCNPGFSNCDGNHANGCETNLLADDDNCGGCGRSCERDNAGSACNGAGACDFACHVGFADCNNDLPLTPSNGCEINIYTSPANCGTCNAACNLPNAVPGCAMGGCFIQSCTGDHANCDTSPTNGCEVNLANDVNNCNACNNKCSFPNASAKCEGRSCAIASCFTDYADCTTAPGCETNTTSDVNHCGGCNLACDLANATPRCTGSGCLIDSCNAGFANCDTNHVNGCEANTNTSLAHCGGCNQACTIPNAVAQCSAPGTCSFASCLPGWTDLDGVNGPGTNGCEYACTPSAGEDRPYDLTQPDYGSANRDTNCDGVDGDASRAFFVATNGDDTFSGTRQFPMRTIQAAINRASITSGIDQVYVSAGTYTGQIILQAGVSVYGGFSRTNNWQRSPSYVTLTDHSGFETNNNVIAMRGTNLTGTARAVVQNLTIRSGGANSIIPTTSQGASSYAVHCVNCPSLSLIGNDIAAGAGAAGQNGANNSTIGPTGGNGGNGGNGSADGPTRGARGAPGTSSCRSGGSGGLGGAEGSNTGEPGFTGQDGVSGGAGGAGGNPGKIGGAGNSGPSGTLGPAGAGGSNSGTLTSFFWRGVDGTVGGRGIHGNGGGGGGGGGGQGGFWVDDGSGNGGGGGGGAGCGGYGGAGGGAAGGSFGLFLVSSTGAIVTRNTILSGQGGPGGNSGNGSSGGPGGNRGFGATHATSEIGAGGNGGNGGMGGTGGYGGGGAGGASIPIVLNATTFSTTPTLNNTATNGTSGNGGTSGGPASSVGAKGLALPLHTL